MNIELPKEVSLIEVGPRDGFQFEKKYIPAELKSEIICRLVEAGLKHIQVASFVNPSRVPQMADAEEVVSRLPESEGVIFSGLVLNPKGLQRALRAGLTQVEISISASDTHGRKNAGMQKNSHCSSPARHPRVGSCQSDGGPGMRCQSI